MRERPMNMGLTCAGCTGGLSPFSLCAWTGVSRWLPLEAVVEGRRTGCLLPRGAALVPGRGAAGLTGCPAKTEENWGCVGCATAFLLCVTMVGLGAAGGRL